MSENEVDYLQPTKFYDNQSLEKLWAHLEEECDEALAMAIPCIRAFGNEALKYKNEAAMELVDVQIMINTILSKLCYPTIKQVDVDIYGSAEVYGSESLTLQIIKFVEIKVIAAAAYKELIRGGTNTKYLYNYLSMLAKSAETLMAWLVNSRAQRGTIKENVYVKNDARGYYL